MLSSLLACCAAPQPAAAPAEPEPLPDGDFVGLVTAAIDAYEREDYPLAEDAAIAALRLRPGDGLARDVLDASRRERHGGGDLARRHVTDGNKEFAERLVEPCSDSYVDRIRAAVDAFCREEFELAENHATVALRLRPDDPLASDLLLDSRRSRHVTMGPYLDLRKREYRYACAALGPPRVLQGDYRDPMVAALDAFCEKDFELAEATAAAALRVRPGDWLASAVIDDSRRVRHAASGGLYYREMMERYRRIRAALGPPGPP